MVYFLIGFIVFETTVFIVYYFFSNRKSIYKEKDRFLLLERYDIILNILHQSSLLAYDRVWREDIVVYLTSGYKLNDEELNKFGKKYVSLVFKCCGGEIVNDLEIIHGSIEPICLHLLSNFFVRVIDNESELNFNPNQSEEL